MCDRTEEGGVFCSSGKVREDKGSCRRENIAQPPRRSLIREKGAADEVYECLQTFLSDSPAPALDYASGLSLQLLIDIRSLPGCSEEANELYRLLRQPHLQALLSAHDTVAQKDYEPVLPPMPDELPEEEEATRTVCLVKNKQPLSSLQRHRKPPPQTSEAGPSSPSFRPTTFPDHVAVLSEYISPNVW
ncbi:hypothetical protein CgunFtcFv8_018768 [Champsocephalus gunnari]|uniref:L27 domain-containing protein n=1 Tax=Champsocephalus gunnari TaxID=52237 RepID=A0AAN8GU74_CHAGU|nr:hypothetical protein CgunFtcFv8_018768 [Champsocephalus gunnari]